MKKIIFLTIYVSLFYHSGFSTPQTGDRLIYKGDTISIYPFILNKYIMDRPDKESIYKEIEKSCQVSTGCWRGFIAWFEIENDSLFLIKASGKKDIDLFLIFGQKNKIFVNWYTGILTSPKNRLLYEHGGWGGYYEYETDFSIKNGLLEKVEIYHNDIKPSPYANFNTRMNFIQSNIDYRNIKAIDEKVSVITSIDDVDINGKITKVSVLKGHSPSYDTEALRVVKSIPQWQVIIRRGKKENIPWALPVTFKEGK